MLFREHIQYVMGKSNQASAALPWTAISPETSLVRGKWLMSRRWQSVRDFRTQNVPFPSPNKASKEFVKGKGSDR